MVIDGKNAKLIPVIVVGQFRGSLKTIHPGWTLTRIGATIQLVLDWQENEKERNDFNQKGKILSFINSRSYPIHKLVLSPILLQPGKIW